MVHWIQAKQAFLVDRDNVRFHRMTAADGCEVLLAPIHGDETETWIVDDPDRLREILARDDLTRWDGRPFVIANASKRLLGFAAGPPEPPDQVHVLVVFDIARSTLPPAGDEQPEWWLLDASREEG